MAQELTVEEYFDKVVAFQNKSLEMTAAYSQVIILAGYAAFFAVWSAVASQVQHWVTVFGGSMMLLSVTVFIGWTVTNLVFLNMHHLNMLGAMTAGLDGFDARVAKVESRHLHAMAKLKRYWIPIVCFCSVTAFVATVLVAGAGFMKVAGLQFACSI